MLDFAKLLDIGANDKCNAKALKPRQSRPNNGELLARNIFHGKKGVPASGFDHSAYLRDRNCRLLGNELEGQSLGRALRFFILCDISRKLQDSIFCDACNITWAVGRLYPEF